MPKNRERKIKSKLTVIMQKRQNWESQIKETEEDDIKSIIADPPEVVKTKGRPKNNKRIKDSVEPRKPLKKKAVITEEEEKLLHSDMSKRRKKGRKKSN
jgi:hypothetical protein